MSKTTAFKLSASGNCSGDQRVHIHLSVRTSPDKRALLLDFLREAIPFYESPGNLKIKLLQLASDPDEFIEIIEYDSPLAFEMDNKRTETDPQMMGCLARWRSLLDRVEVKTYLDVSARVRGS